MVVLGLAVAPELGVRREVDLAAEDGLHAGLGLDLVQGATGLVAGHVGLPLGVAALVGRVGLLHGAALLEVVLVVEPLVVVGLRVVDGVGGPGEGRDAAHVAVVGDGHGGHAELDGPGDHVLDARGAVEHGEVGVVVQVHECHGMTP